MNSPLFIAVAGHPSSGKDTAAHYIVDRYHCAHVSLSGLIREYIIEHNLGEPDRDLLSGTGDALRKQHGGDYLVKLAVEKVAPPAVLSGIRTIEEAKTFQKLGGKIIAITVPIEVRYQRAHARGGLKDDVSFEKFKAQQEHEAVNTDPTMMNVEGVIKMADYSIENLGTKEELFGKIDEIMQL